MTASGGDGAERLHLEDLAVGRRFAAGPLEVRLDEVLDFARRYDPQPFHTDPATRGHPVLGGHSASGWHTAAMTMRLTTEALPLAWGVVGGTIEKLDWLLPVRPGDTLRLEAEVLETGASRSKPGQGWARVACTTLNGRGDAVQRFVARLVVPTRAGA